MEDELPVWCQLRKIPLELAPENALEFAKERINRFTDREFWSIKENSPERSEEVIQEFAGHILLRIAVAADVRLNAWLVEFEGDLFNYRFVRAKESEITTVFRYFFGQDNVMKLENIEEKLEMGLKKKYGLVELREFSRYEKKRITKSDGRVIIRRKRQADPIPEGLRKFIGVRFTEVPMIVGKRQALLLKGWAIAPTFVFRGRIKRAFEERLREKLQEVKEKITGDTSLKPIIRELRRYIRSKKQDFPFYSMETTMQGTLFSRIELFPECVCQLLLILTEKGHLGHGERLQLGLFLKKLGMSMEDQKHFWYQKAVDNIGMTFEEFDSKVGYTIDHLYGKVGSGVDYDAPKCETIITSYYCAFTQEGADEIMKRIQREFEGKDKPTTFDQVLDDLMVHMMNNEPQNACAKLFELRYGKRATKIRHPLSYTRYAAKVLSEKKDEEKKKTTKVEEDVNE